MYSVMFSCAERSGGKAAPCLYGAVIHVYVSWCRMSAQNANYIIRGTSLPGVPLSSPLPQGYRPSQTSSDGGYDQTQRSEMAEGDLVRITQSERNSLGAGPVFERHNPAQVLSQQKQNGAQQNIVPDGTLLVSEKEWYDKILYTELLESRLREAEQEIEAMQVVYQDIVRRVKERSTGASDNSFLQELQEQLAKERQISEKATREKNELIARCVHLN
jgi:hypothetical protein